MIITDLVDLHYSPDDGGWYFQEYDTKFRDRISQLFRNQDEALKAWRNNEIKWHRV